MISDAARPIIVVPCYNEEHRLDRDRFLDLVRGDQIGLLFVDDGSTDGTATVLDHLASRSSSISVLHLGVNCGKGEAIRRGLLHVLGRGAQIVGYYDADLATPPSELMRLVATIQDQPALCAVLGARVARLGSSIQRQPLRHYLGRIYGSAASLALGVRVYDTQCGAKVFRATTILVAALQDPFPSRWSFDVHLIGRLLHGARSAPALPLEAFLEEPLREWHDVAGSKITFASGLRAFLDLGLIAAQRRKRATSAAESGDAKIDALAAHGTNPELPGTLTQVA